MPSAEKQTLIPPKKYFCFLVNFSDLMQNGDFPFPVDRKGISNVCVYHAEIYADV